MGLLDGIIYQFVILTGLTHQDNCTDCSGGMACDAAGLTYPPRLCSAGYYCRYGAQSTTPTQSPQAAICPAGSYCPEGTADPVPCPEGSYSSNEGLHQESDCTNCTGGSYCNETGKGQGSHRLKKYLNLEDCLEKSLKIKFALNTHRP